MTVNDSPTTQSNTDSVTPITRPLLVLVGSPDPDLDALLQLFVATKADTIDLTGARPTIEVTNRERLVSALAIGFAPDTHPRIRVTFVPASSSTEELVSASLNAPSLADLLKPQAGYRSRPSLGIHFQPISQLATGRVIGFEALLRATNGGARVNAEAVFARANDEGWLGELDQASRVLAINEVGSWLGEGLLFLNMTAPDGTFDLDAINTTIDRAQAKGLEPDQLVFEAVEHNCYSNFSAAARQIDAIRGRGVRIAIDDVGDGHSDLRVIAEFAPDIIKVSGNLIAKLHDPQARSIVSTLVEMAHRNESWVVAEGIEQRHQVSALVAMGCDWGQGNLLGGPKLQGG